LLITLIIRMYIIQRKSAAIFIIVLAMHV